MTKTLRAVLIAGATIFAASGMSGARADVIRVAVVTADNAADYQANAALVPTFDMLLKKGSGVKAVYAGTDAEHMSITTTSVWSNAGEIAATVGSADWKAAAAKLKSKSYTIGVFELTP